MSMEIYNTLSQRTEPFVPIEEGKVKMYVCGPTVYNLIHIGNARPICVFDTLRRYLEYRGYQVTFVQNFTDIDDKIIKRANEEGVSSKEIAEKYIGEYEKDAAGLNSRPADIHPRATETVDKIIEIISGLEQKGYAYASNGDVYYRTRRFKDYGKLSHMPLEDLDAGNRIDVSEQKEDSLDFALWKAAKPGEPYWDSPWGQGRPGWHIECTAMINKFLGDTIDIHCGGQDLIFPHHENYRSPMNYSVEVIEQCKAALGRLYNCLEQLEDAAASSKAGEATAEEKALLEGMAKRREQFIAAMDDDLNTADAISAVFDLAKDINLALREEHTAEFVKRAASLFDELTGVLGLLYNRRENNSLDVEVEQLIEERQAARKAKDFKRADEIRDRLKEMGIQLKDTPQGVKWTRA